VEYYRDVVLPRRARIVELTKLEHNAMLAGVYQLLQARQNEANARREYIEAQRDYWSARVNLDRVINGTGPVDFERADISDERRSSESNLRGDH
jgi:cobalt-zinc-cadmium efflux system outer membrane protein